MKFINQPNYFFEALVFCFRKINQNSIYPKLDNIFTEIDQKVSIDPSSYFYFTAFDNHSKNSNYLAMSMLSLPAILTINQETAKKQFHKKPEQFIYDITQNNEKNVIDALDKSDLSDTDKWNILLVYNNFDKHIEILFNLLEEIGKEISSIYRKYNTLFQSYIDFWNNICRQNKFCETLQSKSPIQLDTSESLTIQPTWMNPTSIQILSTNNSLENAHCFLGLMIGEDTYSSTFSKEDVCEQLKLLSDISKYKILCSLKTENLYGSQLAQKLNLSPATISHHVSSLIDKNLLTIKKDSNRIYYELRNEQIQNLLDQIKKDLL